MNLLHVLLHATDSKAFRVMLSVILNAAVIGTVCFFMSLPDNSPRNSPEKYQRDQMADAPPCLYGAWRLVGRSGGAQMPSQTQTLTFHENATLTRREGNTRTIHSCRVESRPTNLYAGDIPILYEDDTPDANDGFAIAGCDASHLTLDKMTVSDETSLYRYKRVGNVPPCQ